MPKLSLIKAEAERLVGSLSETRRQVLQKNLMALCEGRWKEIRGPEPVTSMGRGLWSLTPPLADLFADLFGTGDGRLDEVLEGHKPEWGLALLVMAEIERGDAHGARIAHELMMIFESTKLDASYANRIALALHGGLETKSSSRQDRSQPLRKALAIMSSRFNRWDIKAILFIISLLASAPKTSEAAIGRLRNELEETGIRFIGMDGHIRYEQHGHEHKPVPINQLAEILFELRQNTLG